MDDENRARRVVLSDRLWRTRFAGDLSIIGSTIHLNAEPYEVVGIAPRDFEDPIVAGVDVWTPYALARDTLEENYSLDGVGRLRTGVSLEQARAEFAALSQSMAARWPNVRAPALVSMPLQEDLVAASRGPLQLVLIAVGLVLLVGPGIAASLREAVLQRGVRADEAAPGSGLGLAIVRDLAELYDGSIVIERSPMGGLRARLTLPPAN